MHTLFVRRSPACALLICALSSCLGEIGETAGAFEVGAAETPSPTSAAAAAGRLDGGAVADAGPSGLPCDIDQLLQTSCRGCHGVQPGLPRLTTLGDLRATQGAATVAHRARMRMEASSGPMPPLGVMPRPAPSELAAFAAWVEAGLPEGACGQTDAGTIDAGPNEFSVAPLCSSGRFVGTSGKSLMNPGRACISCHDAQRAFEEDVPSLTIAGTVYPTAHEPDACAGVDGKRSDLQIVLRGADGKTFTLMANEHGNFGGYDYGGALMLPYTATVFANGRSRSMSTPQRVGDCNSCHTQMGLNGAPGRILLP